MVDEQPEILRLAEEDEQEFLASFLSKAHADAAVTDKTDTDIRVDWLLEKLGKRQAQIAQNNAIAEARKLQVEDWRQAENAKIERSISWIEYQIRELLPPDGESFQEAYGQKSRALPFGRVGFRQNPARVEVFDEDRALAWAKLHKLDIKIKESVSKTDLKKAAEHTQDPPDGFEVVPGLEEFYVKADGNGQKG